MDEEEKRVIEQVLSSYWHYDDYAIRTYYTPRKQKWDATSQYQQELIPWYPGYLNKLQKCIKDNGIFLKGVVVYALKSGIIPNRNPSQWKSAAPLDFKKTASMLSQIAREWSFECSEERSYLLQKLSPLVKSLDKDIRVLNPGAGTGRLIADVVKSLGVSCEGNDNSYHMIIMSMYMLNKGLSRFEITIYPYVHSFSHWESIEDQLVPIRIPDLSLISVDLEYGGDMSMTTGSFVDNYGPNQNIKASSNYDIRPEEAYSRANACGSMDIVVTNFFLDTATNILDYIMSITHVLKPNGYWINYGPLLYHFENSDEVETTYEADPYTGQLHNINTNVPLSGLELGVVQIITIATTHFGFKVRQLEKDQVSKYGSPTTASSPMGYKCHYWALQLTDKPNEY